MSDRLKLAAGLRNLPETAREDLAGREQDIQRGKTVELLRRAGKEMYENPIVNTAVGLSPVLGDIQAGVEAYRSAQAGDWGNAGLNAMGMLPFIPMLGKTVWHGSPHTFEKFDLSKIGTGEGAQAYGHGLYFAESPGTARSYQESLSSGPERFLVNGEEVLRREAKGPMLDVSDPKTAAIVYAAREGDKGARKYFKTQGGWGEKAIAELDAMKGQQITNELPGSLYKVDLPDEQIAKMLDWDKPMNQQSDYVLKQLGYEKGTLEDINREADALMQKYGDAATRTPEQNEAFYREYNALNERLDKLAPSISGGDYYRGVDESSRLHNMLGGYQGDAASSANLMQQGIPGIQYLDQASRGAGDGTRNYVVFSDEIPQILERNNQPIAQALRNYGLEHRPMTIEGGASQLHELTPSFGEDVYGKQAMQFFGSGDPREKKALEIMKSVRGNPDAPVTIYRGVPEGVNQINQGDWVTIVPEVAADYGNVISQQVPASHITSWPDSLMEFGYYPPKAK